MWHIFEITLKKDFRLYANNGIILPKLFIFICTFSLLFANAQQNTFEQANKVYETENYTEAVKLYEQLIKEDYQSENLYYNLGNAYFKTGNLGKSILYLEKAQKLAPRNKDIQHNLSFAYAKTTDNIEPLPRLFFVNWWYSLLNFYTASKWSFFGVILLWVAFVLWAVHSFFKIAKLKPTSVIIAVLSMVLLFISYQKNSYDKKNNSAIVLHTQSALKSLPNQNAQELHFVHEGLKVSVIDSVDNWYKIKLQDGTEAWIEKSAVALI